MLHLKMIFRSWWRNGLSTVISLISLTIGLVCSTMLILFVMGEYKIANALGDTERVYILEEQNTFFSGQNVRSDNTSAKMGFDMVQKYGDVEQNVVFEELNLEFDTNKRPKKKLYRVTPNVCDIFDIPVKEGDLRRTLCSASEIAVTESFMQQVYGRSAVLGESVIGIYGKHMYLNGQPIPEVNYNLTITTILDETQKSPLNYGALTMISMADMRKISEGSAFFTSYYNFIKLNAQSSPEKLREKFTADTLFTQAYSEPDIVPFSQIYIDDATRNSNDWKNFINRRDASLLRIGLIVAMAVLLIAAFNYINITMTRARARLKNIAGQRIFGATKWTVRLQTMLDTALLVIISFGLSLLFVNALSEKFNGFMDSNISLADLLEARNISIIIGLLLLLIVLPSLYILLKIEVRSPMETFKNPLGHNVKISSMMVIAQFIISVVLIAVSLNISRQMEFITSQRSMADLILQIYSTEDKMDKEFTDKVKNMACVEAHTNSKATHSGSVANNGVAVNMMQLDNQASKFYNMKLIEGRMFGQSEEPSNVIVNEALLRIFEIERPAEGKSFNFNGRDNKIVGVVEDFMYQDAHKNIQPLMIEYSNVDRSGYYFSIKVNGDVMNIIDEIRAMWREMNPGKGDINVKTLAQIYKDMHPQEQRLMTMVDIFMIISMMLTALGLFGLSFYTVGRRTREIAIRKIHGSTTAQVILMLCRTFAIWVGISVVIAIPIAYYFSTEWLSTFIYRVPMVAWVFLATASIAALITFVTVIIQTWSAARANPANSIKAE